MPSHLFVALGRWDDVVASNEQSVAAADDRMKRKGLGVEERGYHPIWWLEYGYLQQGRRQEALKLLEAVAKNATQTKNYPKLSRGNALIRTHLVWMRAHYVVETRDWNSKVLQMPLKTADLNADMQSVYHFTTGFAALQRGDLVVARKALASLGTARVHSATGQPQAGEHDHAMGNAAHASIKESSIADVLQTALQGLILLPEKPAEAEALLRQATQMEESMRFMFGPPQTVKPSQEILGEVLLSRNRPQEAMQAFEAALKRAPQRVLALQGLAQAAARSNNGKLAQETEALVGQIRRQADAEAMRENK